MWRDTGIRITDDYELEVDVVKDSDGKIEQGLVVGRTTEQNQAMILCHKGENKEYYQLGVGIEDMLNDNEIDKWKRAITHQLSQDGMKVKELDVKEDMIKLEAEYE